MKNLALKSIRLIFGNAKVVMLLCFTVLFFGTNVFSQDATFTTSGTWTAPAGVTCITVKAWGAGGGGAGAVGSNSTGGGGGGAFSTSSVKVIPGQTYSVTVGTGGIGGAAGAFNPGTNGGSTIFSDAGTTKVLATGGIGAQNNAGATGGNKTNNIPAGAGFSGGNGYNGRGSSTGGGGGGGGAGSTANGSNAPNTGAGGTGGNAGGGTGGVGKKAANGGNGVNFGGGGGGVSSTFKGGDGAPGRLTIDYTGSCPIDPIEIISFNTIPSTVCQDSIYKAEVTIKNNTGSNIPSPSIFYAIDYSWDNSTWINNASYVDNVANGATKSYNFNMAAISTVGNKIIYIRVRKVSDASIISTGTGVIAVDYCPKGADNCIDATLVNINGNLQGNTSNYSADNATWMSGSGAFAATVENNGWYKFVANSTSITFSLCAGNCNNNLYGLQFTIFSFNSGASCGSGTISGKFFKNQLAGNTCLNNQTVSGLTIGQTYYMMIDGYEGANCPYSLQFSSGIVLPIELTSFTGKPTPQGNLIQWETASERINDYFELESTTDGINFYIIAKIAGAGSKSTVSNYEFLDKNPAGQITYYRLSQVDYDGESETFEVISVEREARNEIFISPNPVINNLRIEMDVETSTSYTFNLISMSGMQTISNHYLEKGYNSIELDMSQLSKGFYMLQVSDANGSTITIKKISKD